jgi:hypothetical protein
LPSIGDKKKIARNSFGACLLGGWDDAGRLAAARELPDQAKLLQRFE